MKRKIRLLIIGCSLLTFCSFGWAQSGHYRVSTEQEFIESGLSHNGVSQRFKDSRGMIWLVRENGLDCFDGQRFRPTNLEELTGPAILHILLEDTEHDLWIMRTDRTICFLQIYTGHVRSAFKKFGATFPATVYSAIQGANNTFLLQTDLDKIVRYKPGYPAAPYYSVPGKITTPIVEWTNGTVWIDCNNTGKGGELIALDSHFRPKRIIPYLSNYLYGCGLWGENAFHYMTADSFFVVNETHVLEQKSLRDMYLFHPAEDSSAINNWHPWYWMFPPLATILFYGILRYRKKQKRRKPEAAGPEMAVGGEIPIDMANEILQPGMIPENEHSTGYTERLLMSHDRLQKSNPGKMELQETDESDMDSALNAHDIGLLNKVNSIIMEHLDNTELDGKLLSKITGLSHSQLHRKLTVLTGLPTGRYIHHIRLLEAKRLLDQKDLNIADIAYMTGFSDPAYFTRLFTKTFGGSPRSFRN